MKLAGDLAHFSLADLVQVHGLSGRSCSVKVLGEEGQGLLCLQAGKLVHAAYEDLTGMDALVAVLALGHGYFQVEQGEPGPERTLEGSLGNLLMTANERIKAGEVPRPRPVVPHSPAAAGARAPRRAGPGAPARLAPLTSRDDPSRFPAGAAVPRLRRGRGIAIAALASVGVLSIIWFAFSRLNHDQLAASPGSPVPGGAAPERATISTASRSSAAAPAAVEAILLTAPGDAPPRLLSGRPAASPDPSVALKPTIVVRLLISAEGRVAEAKIYRSRLDLAAFEETAMSAAQSYRFSPPLRAGRPVPAWINWPVSFD